MKGISVLIPTYNRPKFLRRALTSVLNQTRLPDEIIISDDNPHSAENFEAIKDLVEQYKGLIKYWKNNERLGVEKNYSKLLKEANYEYIKFLADDDLLHPEALKLMEEILNKHEDVVLVSSHRIPVNEEEEFIYGIEATKPLCKKDQILNGKEVIRKSLIDLKNYVGEFSTYMFRKSLLDINPFYFCNLHFRANADWVLWMYLLSKGNLFYYARPLSFFTVHSEKKEQSNLNLQVSAFKELIEFIFNKKFLNSINIHLTLKERAVAVENFLSYLKLELPVKERIKITEVLLAKYQRDLEKSKFFFKESYTRPPFSIIIVTYNSSSTIEILLASLKASVTDRDEIIIVDNASKDETLSLVKKFIKENSSKNFKILNLKENIGYAAAINKGVEVSKHNYLAFVNPDTVLPNGWINIVYEHLKEKEVGAVGAISNQVIISQNILEFSNFAENIKEKDFRNYVDLINKHLRILFMKQSEKKKFLVGFFLATKKKIFEKVGKFDEELFLGMDDLDYSLKLRENGYKLILPKDLFIYHQGHVSFKKNKEAEKLKELTENTFAEKLIKKYGFGKVPIPEKLWADENTTYFTVFVPTNLKYRFMFKFLDKDIDFRHTAQEILRKPKIGIVTVTYFSSNDIYIMAKSLLNLTYQNFHWYIIDHSEDKEEFERLKKLVSIFPKEKITVISRKNLGYAAGVNFGTSLALKNSCEYIWILNPDIEVEPNTLLELLKTSLFTGIPVVTCKIKDSLERDKLQYDGFRADYRPFSDYPQRIHKVLFLSGANIFLKSDILKNIKFNENYFLYYEDNDFHKNLLKEGIEPIYTPYTAVYHKNKKESFLNSPTEVYYFFRNLIYFIKKEMNYSYLFDILINDLKVAYKQLFPKKRLLKSLVFAIYDGVFNILGKKELFPKYHTLTDDNRILKEYLQLRKISKVLALKKGRDYMFLKPRDFKIFYKYLADAISIIFYSEEKNGGKS